MTDCDTRALGLAARIERFDYLPLRRRGWPAQLHDGPCHSSVAGHLATIWCREGESNPHGISPNGF